MPEIVLDECIDQVGFIDILGKKKRPLAVIPQIGKIEDKDEKGEDGDKLDNNKFYFQVSSHRLVANLIMYTRQWGFQVGY